MRLPLAVVASFAVLAPGAHAGTIDIQSGAVLFSGASEANDLRVSKVELRSGAVELELWERGTTPLAMTDAARAAGCRNAVDEYDSAAAPDPQRVWCPIQGALHADLGGGDDRLIVAATQGLPDLVLPATMQGGAGNDRLLSGLAADELRGGDGDDYLDGLAGDDRIFGDAGADDLRNHDGNDLFEGGDGNDILGKNESLYGYLKDGTDVLRGGAGVDTMSYTRSNRVSVSLDDQPNDGKGAVSQDTEREPKEAEADNVASDVEVVEGTRNDDFIRGNDQANVLRGGGGIDTIFAGGGNDVLDGQDGVDNLRGEDGDDLLFGGLGGDFINAGPGADTVRSDVCEGGSAGSSCLTGDKILSRDGDRDVVACTPSAPHRVAADAGDEVSGCGYVERGHLIPTFVRSSINRSQLWTSSIQRSGVGIEMRCRAACKLVAELVISAKLAKQLGLRSRVVGTGSRTSEPGKTYFVARLKKGVVKRLLRPRRWTVTIRVTAVTGLWDDTYVVTRKRRVRRV